jgi:hypothetical protein
LALIAQPPVSSAQFAPSEVLDVLLKLSDTVVID